MSEAGDPKFVLPCDRLLLLPGDPGFNEILSTPPPNRNCAFIVLPDTASVMVPINPDSREFEDYMEGGAYQERVSEIEDSWLFLPESYDVEFD